ncbi:hypothetical protein V7147_24260 [Bacillus sp. JJ1521]|uniref:hypothetical protein n=1 Tax=Bacillus sp. JJ1521 TaxID=3122957 RepID=UPI002FFF1D63
MSDKQETFDNKPEEESGSSERDRFDRLMFGSRAKKGENEAPKIKPEDGVDFNQLMGQIDEIMTSIDKIKPAFKNLSLSPFLDYFRKK